MHKHLRAEEFYFVLEGVGHLRVGDGTLTVPKYGGVLVGPDQLRQVGFESGARLCPALRGISRSTFEWRVVLNLSTASANAKPLRLVCDTAALQSLCPACAVLAKQAFRSMEMPSLLLEMAPVTHALDIIN